MPDSRSLARRAAAAAFLASALTFCLELSAAKSLLPRFGGSALVWTTSVMVFQALLLAGYGWARLALARGWGRAHAVLLALALLAFAVPLPPRDLAGAPALELVVRLLALVGLPFFALSATVPVLQARLMRADPRAARDAYALYAASNLGAAAGLAAYPLVIEPVLGLPAQWPLWRGAHALVALLCLSCLFGGETAPPAPATEASPGVRRRAAWLLLAAAPCAAMLATTNFLTLDFAAVPLLWTAPLAAYLLTFVLAFRGGLKSGSSDKTLLLLLGAWTALCLAAAAATVLRAGESSPLQTVRRLMDVGKFGYVMAALFVIGMIGHRSLAADRPSSERGMAEFYLWIGAGGWAGSACVGILAPWLGRHASLLSLDWLIAAALAVAALATRDWEAWRARKVLVAGVLAAVVLLVAGAARLSSGSGDGTILRLRNFYGVYAVVDKEGVRAFYHGNTDHGMQALDAARRRVPLTYYNLNSPLREAFDSLGAGIRRVGVVGLGAGAIAAYGKAGQDFDFYELDPDVAAIAGAHFTYLKDTPARARIVLGDARLALEEDADARYDLLILDAFNSGAVPVHLLTEEALTLYLSRVPADGVILLHVSNRYLDLRPLLAAAARDLGLSGAAKRLTQNGRVTDDRVPSSWVALARGPKRLGVLLKEKGWSDLKEFDRGARAWTDRHASLLPALAL